MVRRHRVLASFQRLSAASLRPQALSRHTNCPRRPMRWHHGRAPSKTLPCRVVYQASVNSSVSVLIFFTIRLRPSCFETASSRLPYHDIACSAMMSIVSHPDTNRAGNLSRKPDLGWLSNSQRWGHFFLLITGAMCRNCRLQTDFSAKRWSLQE